MLSWKRTAFIGKGARPHSCFPFVIPAEAGIQAVRLFSAVNSERWR